MRFEGESLVAAINRTESPIELKGWGEHPPVILDRSDAVRLAESGAFYGIGRAKWIRFLREFSGMNIGGRVAARLERRRKALVSEYISNAKDSAGREPVRSIPITTQTERILD